MRKHASEFGGGGGRPGGRPERPPSVTQEGAVFGPA